ncbi:hypothetical protein H5410_026254 [Solanum commersonii]|uniref:Uncharacterized protein n=1 Tax=Solanum commersonii TaxID=4109 RepID=A0A9J5YWI2_SOLCO|nr:hypothetical protein H5410_026254 [Solanum commersonii]
MVLHEIVSHSFEDELKIDCLIKDGEKHNNKEDDEVDLNMERISRQADVSPRAIKSSRKGKK